MRKSVKAALLGLMLAMLSLGKAFGAEEEATLLQGIPYAIKGLQVEVGQGHSWLGNNYSDWLNTYLTLEKRVDSGIQMYGTSRQAEQYGLKDQEYLIGSYIPAFSHTLFLIEGNFSPEFNFLPKWSALAELDSSWGSGWGTGFGVRETEYASSRLTMGVLRLERYFSAFYASYTYRPVNLENAGFASAHSLQANYYYGEKSYIGASFSIGKELEAISSTAYLASDIEEYVLNGRHWLTDHWAVAFEGGSHRQGSYYTRRWISAGVRREF